MTSAEGQRAIPTCTRTPDPLAPCPPEEAMLWAIAQWTKLRQSIDENIAEEVAALAAWRARRAPDNIVDGKTVAVEIWAEVALLLDSRHR